MMCCCLGLEALKHHMGDKAAGVSDGLLGVVADTQMVRRSATA